MESVKTFRYCIQGHDGRVTFLKEDNHFDLTPMRYDGTGGFSIVLDAPDTAHAIHDALERADSMEEKVLQILRSGVYTLEELKTLIPGDFDKALRILMRNGRVTLQVVYRLEEE